MKIEFRVRREIFTEKRTIGKMYVNGEYLCDTLEDKDRHLETTGQSAKVYSQTAIPRGRYKMVNYLWTKYNNWYPWIQNVPYFQGILIHGGSMEDHTSGCILVGTKTSNNMLMGSADAMKKIRKIFSENKGAEFWITVE